ncbi:MAG: phosphate regulon sensor histidine kinase PhoR [SAR86 cluster bacterium]|uniref:histidine kinase n=1 Tax=SAR86 cluster bacterium TaxID=2030880 RepID=A0A2A5CH01_9GAMM|nr:MAG: phosphate regulon sensor histidine kinase PhoR [SAR86 cluster bacterium]
MLGGIKFELKIFSIGLLVALFCSWLSGQSSLCILTLLIIYFLWHLRSAWTFFIWVDRGMKKPPPKLIGFWHELFNTLAQRRQQQIKSVKRMRLAVKRTSQLTHAIDEGIVVLKKDLSLSWWNSTAKIQLGFQASDRGHLLTSLIREPKLINFLSQKKLAGRVELPSKVNPAKWLMFTASRFGDGDIALVVSDITPLKNAERLRKEFVGNVSHELRTPITVLRGYLETLTDGIIIDNPQVQKACEQMSEQVIRMQDLADDLIVLSKLESQSDIIEKTRIKLFPLLGSLIDEAKIMSEEQYNFTLDCPADIYLMAQESDLHSAIGNLLFNAVNHNPDGANINVRVIDDGISVKISVKDNGIGISADAIPRLTERFYRTDSSRNSNVGGSGLGLAIVKHVLGRYDGNLEINSRLGEGAEFICSFPCVDNR